jgi:hypothetical protein
VARGRYFSDGTIPAYQILNGEEKIMENMQKYSFFAWYKVAISVIVAVYALLTSKWPDCKDICSKKCPVNSNVIHCRYQVSDSVVITNKKQANKINSGF